MLNKLSRKSTITHLVVDQETILLDASNETYFSLNRVGASIWTFLETQDCTVMDIASYLQQQYGIAEKRSLHDAIQFVESMIKSGLINAQPPTNAVTKSILSED